MNVIKKQKKLSGSQRVLLSFAGVILVGALLFMLPITNHSHVGLNPIDALFTAVSATCVTGLTVIVPVETLNLLGQIVLLVLIQIGGLGLMTLIATFMSVVKSKIKLSEKIVLRDVLSRDNLLDLKVFMLAILKYTLFFEMAGALILCFVFIPQFGVVEGIFKSIFISISAFCNAGFDILGATSLEAYATNPIVSFTVMALIIFGGLGFIVWFDIRSKYKQARRQHETRKKVMFKRFVHSLTLHTKLVLIASMVLLIVPAIIIFILEQFTNSMSQMTPLQQMMNSLFMSTSLRTAGFASIPMSEMHVGNIFLMIIVMFIGGSPGGTAGGVKTTTIAVILICVHRMLRGKTRTNIFKRHISREIIVRATTIVVINLIALFVGIFILLLVEQQPPLDLMFEAVSALATVGLTVGITPELTIIGKIVIIALMFVGRIGIITFLMTLIGKRRDDNNLQYAEGHITVG